MKRANDDRPPPPSYSRRGVEEGAGPSSAGPSRQGSASLSRKNSAALPGRVVAAGEVTPRSTPITGDGTPFSSHLSLEVIPGES